MKKSILTSVCAAILLSTNVSYAEVNTVPSSVATVSVGMAEANDLLQSMNMDNTYSKMIDKMLQAQSAMFPKEISEDKEMMEGLNKIMNNFLHKYIGWDKIKEDMAKLYAKHYTPSELKDIKTFYLTPTGKKSLEIMPQVMAESMQLTQSKIMPHMGKMQEEIEKFMQSKLEKK